MVKFLEDKFVIEVPSTSPAEDWILLQDALCDVLRNLESDSMPRNFFEIPNLLQAMMPDWKTAKKMEEK